MENNFIPMAASAGHAVAYAVGLIFKHIIDICAAVFHQWLYEYCCAILFSRRKKKTFNITK